MKVKEIVELDKKKVKICLEDGTVFALYKGEARRFSFEEGRDIADEILEDIYSNILQKRARERCFYLLQSMDKTERELQKKLKQGYYPDFVIDSVINFLKQYGYVDDRRYVQNYIRMHSRKKSRRLLEQELYRKGLDRELISEALSEMLEETEGTQEDRERELIYQLLEKKHFVYPCEDRKEWNRIMAYLLRKGFQMDDVQFCMKTKN